MNGHTRRRLAWGIVLLPILAGPLGCQSAGGGTRIRMPLLTGPDLTPCTPRGWSPPPGVRLDASFQPAAFLRDAPKESDKAGQNTPPPASGASVPGGEEAPVVPAPAAADCIDLATALEQAGVENPTIGLAQEAVRASLAEQLQARALLLPSLEAGASYDLHRGRLQNAQGAILDVNRQSLYGGAGASAVGAGTVGFPGVHLYADLGDAVFAPRVARDRVTATSFDATATQNTILLEVTTRYLALVEAEAHVAAIRQSEADFRKVADMTAEFSRTGQGRQADADRAKADALLLHAAEQQAEEDEAVASAELARLLSRDPSAALHTPGGPVPMVPLVDPRLGLEALVRIAVDNRPETAARAADVALNEARLREEQFRPLLPVVSVGYSAGQFGGGSDTTDPRFGAFSGRTDFDAYAFWSLENLGVGNWARAAPPPRRGGRGRVRAPADHRPDSTRDGGRLRRVRGPSARSGHGGPAAGDGPAGVRGGPAAGAKPGGVAHRGAG